MHQLTWLGVALILIGVALVLFPILGKYIDFSQVPSWLIYKNMARKPPILIEGMNRRIEFR